MTNDLQAALIPLAEKAKVRKPQTDQRNVLVYQHDPSTVRDFPGRNGTLSDAEVTVVLGWLAKGRYEVRVEWSPTTENYRVMIHYMIWNPKPDLQQWTAYGDTLHAALKAAVIALHENGGA